MLPLHKLLQTINKTQSKPTKQKVPIFKPKKKDYEAHHLQGKCIHVSTKSNNRR
jgi:hypothetical protein